MALGSSAESDSSPLPLPLRSTNRSVNRTKIRRAGRASYYCHSVISFFFFSSLSLFFFPLPSSGARYCFTWIARTRDTRENPCPVSKLQPFRSPGCTITTVGGILRDNRASIFAKLCERVCVLFPIPSSLSYPCNFFSVPFFYFVHPLIYENVHAFSLFSHFPQVETKRGEEEVALI